MRTRKTPARTTDEEPNSKQLSIVAWGLIFASAAAALVFARSSFGANGLDLIGFGGESGLMAGADVAVARDTTALNTNPAGLAQIKNSVLDFYAAVAFDLDVAHADQYGNDKEVSNHAIPLAGAGYAHRVAETTITWGFGLFGQGGAGNVYKDLNTAFGTRDDLSGIFRIARLSPGAAWQATDSLSLGASLILNVADLNQKVFPNTSFFNAANPSQSFFGFELKNARAFAPGIKIGMQYHASASLTLGAAYGNKTKLPLENGTLRANMTAVGLGTVTYHDARVEGLALPHDVAAGVSYRVGRKWLIAAEVNWLNWKDALKTSRLVATNPDNPAAPQVLQNSTPLDWKDQYVLILAAEYEVNTKTRIRGGYNYGKNPVPPQTTNPLLAAIGEHHLTLGVVRSFGGAWELASGIEYQFPARVTYTNPSLPFGVNAQERSSYIALQGMLSRRW